MKASKSLEEGLGRVSEMRKVLRGVVGGFWGSALGEFIGFGTAGERKTELTNGVRESIVDGRELCFEEADCKLLFEKVVDTDDSRLERSLRLSIGSNESENKV